MGYILHSLMQDKTPYNLTLDFLLNLTFVEHPSRFLDRIKTLYHMFKGLESERIILWVCARCKSSLRSYVVS